MAESLQQRQRRKSEEIERLPIPPAEKTRLRAALAADLAAQRAQRVGAVVQEEARSQQSSSFRRAAGSVVAGVLHGVDTATLGHLPEIGGLLAGPESEERLETALTASQQLNPLASGVGSLGGLFTGAAGVTARGGAAVGRGALNRLPGVGQAVARGRQAQSFTPRAAASLAQNLASGGGALTAFRALEDSDETLAGRFSAAADDIRSPLNLGLTVGTGLITARLGGNPAAQEIQRVARRFEQVTGRKAPADVLSDRATLQQFMDQASQNPLLANDVRRVQRSLTQAMDRFVQDMGRRRGVRNDPQAAGSAVRDLQGRLTEARRAPQRAALEHEGGNLLSVGATRQLRDGLSAILRSNTGREPRGAFMPIARRLHDFTIRRVSPDPRRLPSTARGTRPTFDIRQPTIDELEGLRKMTANLAFTKSALDPRGRQISDRARVEARRFYQVLDQAFESGSPEFSRALRAGERLRRMEETLPRELRNLQVNDAAMGQFFRPAGLLGNRGRYQALVERGTPTEVGAAKGWLFHRLAESVTGTDGLINEATLKRTLRSQGPLNRQTLDRVLPGVADELLDAAKLSSAMRRGVMSPRGSQTASRGLVAMAQQSAPFAVAGTVAGLLSNPFGTAATVLGVAGSQVAITAVLRSLVAGRGQEALQRAVTGQTRGLAVSPIAAQELVAPFGPQPGAQP